MSLESNDPGAARLATSHDGSRFSLAQLSFPVSDQAVPVFAAEANGRTADISAILKEAAKAYIGVDTGVGGWVAAGADDTLSCWFGVLRER